MAAATSAKDYSQHKCMERYAYLQSDTGDGTVVGSMGNQSICDRISNFVGDWAFVMFACNVNQLYFAINTYLGA